MTTLAATLLGVTPQAAAVAGLANFAVALFQHLNLAMPRWTGFVIQRPEAHVLHHERDVHSRNFGDLPVWDMLFGTYANPGTVDVAVGFEPERSRRIFAMLACIDVNKAQGRAKL
jgi:sterol desaturase/sphingolipid hydroxylase (fatty acid hydroxylase superfamily)